MPHQVAFVVGAGWLRRRSIEETDFEASNSPVANLNRSRPSTGSLKALGRHSHVETAVSPARLVPGLAGASASLAEALANLIDTEGRLGHYRKGLYIHCVVVKQRNEAVGG